MTRTSCHHNAGASDGSVFHGESDFETLPPEVPDNPTQYWGGRSPPGKRRPANIVAFRNLP